MKKILIPIALAIGLLPWASSCRMAPAEHPGDTVAAKVFEPVDTSKRSAAASAKQAKPMRDSTDLYIIGEESSRTQVQLVSYPSRRDTIVYAKGKHIKVVGNADYGHVVRVKTWISDQGDTLVTRLEEYHPQRQVAP